MVRRFGISLALFLCIGASRAAADPVYFDINNCTLGDCGAFAQSGGGSILARLELVNGNDLLFTLTNALNADASNDSPFLTALGFEYGGDLSGLTFDHFAVLSGTVARPLFTVNEGIRSFVLDFGFGFSVSPEGRFQAMDTDEVIQILVGTTGDVALSQFHLGVAKLAGAGDNGLSGSIVLTGTPQRTSIPEPGSLMALLVGFGAFTIRQYRKTSE